MYWSPCVTVYTCILSLEAGSRHEASFASADLRPLQYVQKTRLLLPLAHLRVPRSPQTVVCCPYLFSAANFGTRNGDTYA